MNDMTVMDSTVEAQRTKMAAQNVNVYYGDTHAIKDVNVEIEDKTVTAFIGPSGCGKSTIAKLLLRLEDPTSGKIMFNGDDVTAMAGDDLLAYRRAVQAVFQDPFAVFNPFYTVDHLLAVPIKRFKLAKTKAEARDKAEALLKRVGLEERMGMYPSQLSGGQQQRVAIARALAMEPDAILFDEPTSALDPELVGEVLKVMQDLAAEGRTMIVVTHEMGFAREVSSEVVFLHEGRIAEQGPPEEMFTNPRTEVFERFIAKVM